MRKIFTYLLIIVLLIFNVAPVKADDDIFYEDFGPFLNVELDKMWKIVFNHSNIYNNVRVWIEDSVNNVVPTRHRIEGNALIVEPIENYRPNEEYTLYIARTSSQKLERQQKILFTTSSLEGIDLIVKERIREIREYWDAIQPIHKEIKYLSEPSAVYPYSLGKLADETLNSALKVTNFIRYIAYLSHDVKLNKQFNIEAQAASVVNAANDELTHYPKRPVDMEEELYELGYKGASKSNIGYGYRTIIDSIINGYMEDGDSSNISSVGHRLWILSPKLKEVGFGFASNEYGWGYTAMKVVADNMYLIDSEPYEYISWPARIAMPIELFTGIYPWSVSLNPDIYDSFNTKDIEVELIRLNDNKTWKFSNNSKDGFFNVSTANYGYLPFTIIFRPHDMSSYEAGDRYRVTISNLRKINGEVASISFETTFFQLND